MKKLFRLLCGIFCACLLLMGILLLIFPKPLSVTASIVIICLTLATGILIPNPISLAGLIMGICLLWIPAPISGILVGSLGLIGMTVNFIGHVKKQSA